MAFEGTGSYGAGFDRRLPGEGFDVAAVSRPNRKIRRRRGESDTVDAEATERAALHGEATAEFNSGDGCTTAGLIYRSARRALSLFGS